MLIIPAIDLHDGQCVRLSQGRKDSVTVYDDDPVRVACRFVGDGAKMLHVVDLDAAFGESHEANWKALGRLLVGVNVPIQLGGGIRTANDVSRLLSEGVSRVVLGTVAVESGEILRSLIDEFGPRVCVAIDARDGVVLVRGWESATLLSAVELAKRVAIAGAERIIYTDTVRDGMLSGLNIGQTVTIARESRLPVTASGGISSLNDITNLKNCNESLVDSVIVGKALYEKKFSLKDALRICKS